MTVKVLTEQHLELQSLKGGCTGSYESTLVKMPHCWKSYAMAHMLILQETKIYNLNVLLKLTLVFVMFLAHLSHRLKVSFCDHRMSVISPFDVCQQFT